MTKPDSWRKVTFMRFLQKSHPFISTFLLEYEIPIGILTFCQNHISGINIWFLSYIPKIARPIRMQDSLSYNTSQMRRGLLLNFFMLLDIHRSNKFIQSFQMSVVRHAWSCSKLWQIVSQLYLNNKLSYKVRDWPSGLRRYIQNRKDPGSNHTRCLVVL